jgi:hypothetical protein
MKKSKSKVVEFKVVEFKLGGVGYNFHSEFLQSFNVFRDLFNEIVHWGNNTILVKDGLNNKEIDCQKERRRLYEKHTDRSISFDNFELCLQFLYDNLLSEKGGRAVVAPIFGTVRNINKIDPIIDFSVFSQLNGLDKPEKKQLRNKLFKSVSATLKKIGFLDRFPFQNDVVSAVRYSIISNINYKSWQNRDTNTKTSYEKEEQEIIEHYNEIDDSYVGELKNFFDYCLSENIIHHFDNRARSYMKDCLLPSLKKGEKECPKGFRLNGKGNKCRYSLDEKFYNYLQKNPILWEGEEIIAEKYWFILELIMIHKKHLPRARFPLVKEKDIHRFKFDLGNNYTDYELISKGGTGLEDVSKIIPVNQSWVETTFTGGVETRQPTIKIGKNVFDIYISKRQGKSTHPNPYFKKFKFWHKCKKNEKGKLEHDKSINLICFERKSGNEFYALVREPSLIFKNDNFFIRLNFTILDRNVEVHDYSDLAELMNSSLPSCKEKQKYTESAKNIVILEKFSGKSFNMMGVDLGMAAPFAYSVANVKINGSKDTLKKNSVRFLDWGTYESQENEDYRNLLSDQVSFGRVVAISKSFSLHNEDGLDFSEDTGIQLLIENAKKYFTKHDVLTSKDKKCLFSKNPSKILKDFIKYHKNNLEIVKKSKGSLIKVLFRYLDLCFNNIKDQRKRSFEIQGYKTIDGSEYTWLRCIERMKRCCRSMSYLGLSNDRKVIETSSLNDYYNNCKDNFLKTICSSIAEKANENNCVIVFVERLEGQSSYQTKKENFLSALWSPAKIKKQLKNALSWYNIELVDVNENCTSQRECDSKKFGYRNGRTLYWEEDGEIYEIDADINAAKNILVNGATRHYDLYQINVSNFGRNKIGVRMGGALTVRFGTIENAQVFFEEKKKTLDKSEKSDYFYLHSDKWISQKERSELENEIKTYVGG